MIYGKQPFISGMENGQSNFIIYRNDNKIVSNQAINLLELILSNDHLKRPTAKKILNHKWFKEITPASFDDIYTDNEYQQICRCLKNRRPIGNDNKTREIEEKSLRDQVDEQSKKITSLEYLLDIVKNANDS